jgi:hypothetical protein
MFHLSIKQKVIVLIASNSYVSLPKGMVLFVENQHFCWEKSPLSAASIISRHGDDSFQLS